ncbi:MAG: response regulator transcription factor [Ignavibacteriales bacterium]|nr:response regulator transcription factor [Ignavibacteriales bacterium]
MDTIRVVLADDHAEFRRVVREFLKRLPHVQVVGEAADGTEAIEQVARLGPDFVLMDINMPALNGLEATRIIKERWPAVLVLIATTHDNNLYRLQALEAKADAYALKSDLKRTLEAVLNESHWLSEALAALPRVSVDGLTRPGGSHI